MWNRFYHFPSSKVNRDEIKKEAKPLLEDTLALLSLVREKTTVVSGAEAKTENGDSI